MSNNLWYCKQPPSVSTTNIHTICRAVIRSLNQTATYELWHHRMGHAGKHAMEKLSQMVDGVPTLFPKIHYTSAHIVLLAKQQNIWQDTHHPSLISLSQV